MILSISAFQNKILGPKICIYVAGLTEKTFIFMVCVVFQELSTVVLTKLLVLQLQFKMQFRFSQDNLVFASTFAVYSHNYNHAGTQLFVSLSL